MPVILRWLLTLGPTNPITVRLVQSGSRRPKHAYIRSGYLAALILVLLWALVTAGSGPISYRDMAARGAASFEIVAYLQIGLICILAPVFMAGAIAQEANPKTWDILLTTPLSSAQIVLGNLLGRLFFVLALLAASLPLFALTQYFGGVPGKSILTSYLIAGCAAILVGAIAISLSVSRLAGRRAVFTFYVAVVSYLAITWAIDVWLRQTGQGAAGGKGVTLMTGINPFLALAALLNPSTYPRAPEGTVRGVGAWLLETPVSFWCIASSLLSVLLVITSTITVRLGGLAGVGIQSTGVPWHRRLLGLGGRNAEHRPPRNVWNNPIAWREAAARNSTLGKMLSRWAFIAAGGAFGIILVLMYHSGGLATDEFRLALMATVWGEIAVTTLVTLYMASTCVSREREDGTLDLLLATPITPAQYLSGKLRGLVAYVLPMISVPIGTLALAGLYVMMGGFGRSDEARLTRNIGQTSIEVPVVLPEAGLIAPLLLIPFIGFCAIVGVQWSLKSRATIPSVVTTVGIVGAILGVVSLCGWRSGSEIAFIGPMLAALSPASLIFALIEPVDAMFAAVSGGDLNAARTLLAIGAAVGGGVYGVIVYTMHLSMSRSFDVTVRKLAGLK